MKPAVFTCFYLFYLIQSWQEGGSSPSLCLLFPSAFALDLFGCGVYPFPPGAPGSMSFHDPLEGTETSVCYTI